LRASLAPACLPGEKTTKEESMNRFMRVVFVGIALLVSTGAGAHETTHLVNAWSEVCTGGKVAQYRYMDFGVTTYSLSAAQVQAMCLNPDNFDGPNQPCADGECSMRAQWNSGMPRGLYCEVYGSHNLTGGIWSYSDGVGYDSNGTCVTPQYFVADYNPTEENPAPGKDDLGPSCPSCGNPVDPATGNKYQTEVDYVAGGSGSLRFERSYNSLSRDLTSSGAGWRHSFDRSLTLDYGIQPTYQQGAPSNSQKFTTKQAACEQGWPQIKARHQGLAATTALYQSNVCNLYQGATLRGTAPVYSTPFNPPMNPTLAAVHAQRPGGKSIRFASGATFTPKADVTAKLEQVAGGYKLTDNDTVEMYDTAGKLLSITDRSGYQQTMGYDAQGRLQSVTDSFGRSLGFTYDASNRIETLTDAAAQVYTYSYSSAGNLISVEYPDGKTRTYHYEDSAFPNALTGVTDENEVRFATWAYDDMGRAYMSEHAGGAGHTEIAFGSNSATITEGAQSPYTYTFTQPFGVKRVTSLSQRCAGCDDAAATTYDANGFVNTTTDFNGNVTDYTFNSRGLEDSRVEAYGAALARTVTTQWHATLRLPTQIDEPGRRITYTYDSSGNRLTQSVLDTTTSETRTTTWTYTTAGRVLTVDGPRTDVSDVTSYTYYNCATGGECGQVHTITNALGHVTEVTSYNAHGNPLTIVDPNGVTTTLTYDLRQRLKTRSVAGATTTFDYDGVGQLDKVTMPDGSLLDYTYDPAHRLTEVEDGAGNRIHYTLDLAGKRTAEEVFDPADVLKRKHTQVFNVLGRLEELKDSSGQVVAEYAYDAQGNRTHETAYAGILSSFQTVNQFDALNRMWRSTAPDGGVTQYGYNARDQLAGVTDPRSLTTTYVMNALGDVAELNSPDTGVTGYEYDAAGNRTSQVDARGVPVAYSYDALNRLTFVDYTGAGEEVTYTYDSTAQPYGKGRLTGIQDAAGTTTLIYDARGNVTQEQRVIGGSTYTTSYAHDSADRITSITYPSGRLVTYTRNSLGQVTAVTTTVGSVTTTIAQDITYMPFGGVKSYTLGNGIVVTRSYDTDYRLQDISDQGSAAVQHLDLDYDRRGNVTLKDDLLASSAQNFAYDEVSRLTSATGAYGTQGFTYDDVGNRLTRTGTSPETYDYATDSHRLSSLGSGATVLYDDAGNVTSKGVLSLAYNQAHRLVTASLGGVTVTSTYGANGQRVTKSVGGVTTTFQYDRGGQLLAEQSDGGMLREYVWLGDLPLAQSSAAGLAYFHVDQLNTPQKMTDASQAVVWQASYTPFGDANVTSSGGFDNPLRFPGQYFDAETGLHQNWHRDYDPNIGRYLQSDPIGLEGGLNTYLYAKANPSRFKDPDGLDAIACAFGDGSNCLPGEIPQSPPPPPPPPGIAPCVMKCVAMNQATGAVRDYAIFRGGLLAAQYGPPKFTVPASLTAAAALKKAGFYYAAWGLGEDIGTCLAECEQANSCPVE
jgi:RHS repeat-associated protein